MKRWWLLKCLEWASAIAGVVLLGWVDWRVLVGVLLLAYAHNLERHRTP